MKGNGTNQIDLSFAQLADIQALLEGKCVNPWGGSDTVDYMFVDNLAVTNSSGGTVASNFLQYFTQQAKAAGFQIGLSFGGQNAAASDWMLPSGGPVQAANDLLQFMSQYNISSVDFDCEGNGPGYLMQNGESNVLQFFQVLHNGTQADGMQSLITLGASVFNGPAGPLSCLFGSNFNSCFDGVNLMQYSSAQDDHYYLVANDLQGGTGIEQWLPYVGNNLGMLHFGFCAGVEYNDPSAYSGPEPFPYNIPEGTSPGTTATMIYQQLLQQLQGAGFNTSNVATPFWWVDSPTDIYSGATSPGGLSVDQMMGDFYNYLSANNLQK